jgi:heat-inducible transcriptional repressor
MSEPAFPGGVKVQDPDLSDRERQVFGALVRMHARTAQPVGSEAIGRSPGIRWSGARIRSTLAELESRGLVAREHVSSGRVPTAEGYAFFVRCELTPASLPPEVVREVDERLRRASRDLEALLVEASRVLSRLTRQLGLAVATSFEQERLTRLELAPLGPRRTLMVLSLGGGAVHTLALDLEHALERAELEAAAAVLEERLAGLTLAEVRRRLATDEELVGDAAVRIVARAARASWTDPGQTFFSAGAAEFATQPEFADRGKLGSLLRLLESGSPLDRLMVKSVEGQPAVRVALDEDLALTGLSLVSFPLPGRVRRAVGVLGPLRMDYARCLAAVDVVGTRVADYL